MLKFLLSVIVLFVIITIVLAILGATGMATIFAITTGELLRIFIVLTIILIIVWLLGKIFRAFE